MNNNDFKFYSSKSTILRSDNCSDLYNLVTPPENCAVVFQWSHLRKYYIKKDYKSLPKYVSNCCLTPPNPIDYIKCCVKPLTHFIMLFKTTECKVFGIYINRNDLNDNDLNTKKLGGKPSSLEPVSLKLTKPSNETPSFLFSLNHKEILDFKKLRYDCSNDFGVATNYTDKHNTSNLIVFKLIKNETNASKLDNTKLKGTIQFRFPLIECNGRVLFDIFNRQCRIYRQSQYMTIEMDYEEVEIYAVKEPLTINLSHNDKA